MVFSISVGITLMSRRVSGVHGGQVHHIRVVLAQPFGPLDGKFARPPPNWSKYFSGFSALGIGKIRIVLEVIS